MSTDLVPVPVPGADDLMAVQFDGHQWAALKPMCETLGIDPATQIRKLQRRSWAVVGQRPVTAADGKTYQTTVVDSETIPMWLATIDENRVAEEAKPKLVAYQREARHALDAYFNAGGAINPRATEDQLERLSRQATAQAAVLNALKGIVDPKHLEAKGRIILARALGEAPEIAAEDIPLYVWDYLRSQGLAASMVEAKAPGFGKRLKALYTVEHDRAPEKHHQQLSNGQVREVFAYTERDRALFDSVWARHYANVVADSALTVITGGAS